MAYWSEREKSAMPAARRTAKDCRWGFAAVNPQEIRRGVHQLALALEEPARPHL